MNSNIIIKYCSYDQHLARILTSIQDDLLQGIGCYIAGGSALKLYLKQPLDGSDIDIWFKTQDDYERAVKLMVNHTLVTTTPNSATYIINKDATKYDFKESIQVQFIQRAFYPSEAEAVFADFDFTICQVIFNNGRLLLSTEAFRDIRDKILRKNPNYEDEITPFRFLKYMHRGYVPTIKLFNEVFIKDRESLKKGDLEIKAANGYYG